MTRLFPFSSIHLNWYSNHVQIGPVPTPNHSTTQIGKVKGKVRDVYMFLSTQYMIEERFFLESWTIII